METVGGTRVESPLGDAPETVLLFTHLPKSPILGFRTFVTAFS